jgi:hypothetical protein
VDNSRRKGSRHIDESVYREPRFGPRLQLSQWTTLGNMRAPLRYLSES